MNTETVSERIYNILTQRTFRNGSLPDEKRKHVVLKNIQDKVSKNLPIKFLQFWGGSKNSNLPIVEADLCEEATLEQLAKMNDAVKKVYEPGLFFHIVPGDERVQIANKIEKERTNRYVDSLVRLTSKHPGLFQVTPVSVLYAKNNFYTHFNTARQLLAEKIKQTSNFEKLVKGAKNNVVKSGQESEEEMLVLSSEAALNYSLVRAVEEKAEIFKEFEDYIRSYFVKHIPFYEQIKLNFTDIEMTKPRLDRSLFFFTGRKGNITQPWQAIGVQRENEVVFVSQTKLKEYRIK